MNSPALLFFGSLAGLGILGTSFIFKFKAAKSRKHRHELIHCPECGEFVPGHATGAHDICDCHVKRIADDCDQARADLAEFRSLHCNAPKGKMHREILRRTICERYGHDMVYTLTCSLNPFANTQTETGRCRRCGLEFSNTFQGPSSSSTDNRKGGAS